MPAAPTLPAGPWIVIVRRDQYRVGGTLGCEFHRESDARSRKLGWAVGRVRNFKDTIRSGRHLGRGRPILPPMPIPMYKHMTDADIEAVFAYLQSIPAISNRVRSAVASAGGCYHCRDGTLRSC